MQDKPNQKEGNFFFRIFHFFKNKGGKRGAFSQDDLIVQNLIAFSKLRAGNVMVPKTEIVSVSSSAPFDVVKEKFIQTGHTRLPVYWDDLDDLRGFIHMKDFLAYLDKTEQFSIPAIMRPMLYSPRTQSCQYLLKQMQKSAIHLSVVLDEYGGIEGIVFIDNLIEEIVGDIRDEHDKEEPSLIEDLKNGLYLIDAKTDIESVQEALGVTLSDEHGEYETFGGFILAYLDRMPVCGEKISIPSNDKEIQIEIIQAQPNKIRKTKVRLK